MGEGARSGEPPARWGIAGRAHEGEASLEYLAEQPSGRLRPLVDAETGVVVVLDGRVDSRAELGAALEAAGCPARSDDDAELILRAYAAWGDGCAVRVLGEFAFALWDPRRHRLLCARDPSGVRPLFYSRTAAGFRFATVAAEVLSEPAMRCSIDEVAVLDLLMTRGCLHPDRTPSAEVLRLPAGHTLLMDGSSVRVRRHWSIEDDATGDVGSFEEAVEECIGALQSAIRDRVARTEHAGILLSGGWDSGSLFEIWQAMRERGEELPEPSTFTTYTDYPESDERAEVLSFLDRWPASPTFLHLPADFGPFDGLAEQVERLGLPEQLPWWQSVRESARTTREVGPRVLLAGIGGELFFKTSFLRSLDLLRRGRPKQAWVQLRIFAGEYGQGPWDMLWPQVVRPSIQRRWPRAWSGLRRMWWRAPGPARWSHPFLTDRLRRRIPEVLSETVNEHRRAFPGHPLAVGEGLLFLPRLTQRLLLSSSGYDEHGIHLAMPYLDRRMLAAGVRGAAADPEPHDTRHLLRSMVRRSAGETPERTYTHATRWAEDSMRAAVRRGDPLLAPVALSDLGVIDPAAFRTFLAAFEAGSGGNPQTVWEVASLEAWARRWASR